MRFRDSEKGNRTVYEKTKVQLCIVHLVRAALRYVNHTDSKAVVRDLKKI